MFLDRFSKLLHFSEKKKKTPITSETKKKQQLKNTDKPLHNMSQLFITGLLMLLDVLFNSEKQKSATNDNRCPENLAQSPLNILKCNSQNQMTVPY